jgi:hypothetical protein
VSGRQCRSGVFWLAKRVPYLVGRVGVGGPPSMPFEKRGVPRQSPPEPLRTVDDFRLIFAYHVQHEPLHNSESPRVQALRASSILARFVSGARPRKGAATQANVLLSR